MRSAPWARLGGAASQAWSPRATQEAAESGEEEPAAAPGLLRELTGPSEREGVWRGLSRPESDLKMLTLFRKCEFFF